MKSRAICQTTLAIGWTLVFAACTPVFSELQTARMAGKGNFELTPSYSTVSNTSDGETAHVQSHLGVQAAYGLSERFDLRLRYELAWLDDTAIGDGISVLAVAPKYSLLANRIAASLPVGRALGEGTSDSWQFHPTLLLTLPVVSDKLDVTLAPKYLVTFCEDCPDFVAFNVNLAISTDLNKWALRPEYGLLYDPGESGHAGQFSLGFTAYFGR